MAAMMTTSTTTIIAIAINCSNFDIRASPPPVQCSNVKRGKCQSEFCCGVLCSSAGKASQKMPKYILHYVYVCVAASSLIMMFLALQSWDMKNPYGFSQSCASGVAAFFIHMWVWLLFILLPHFIGFFGCVPLLHRRNTILIPNFV